ncbi:hypothetical protein ACO0SA_004090 [Hanseniaspora valbyensis]
MYTNLSGCFENGKNRHKHNNIAAVLEDSNRSNSYKSIDSRLEEGIYHINDYDFNNHIKSTDDLLQDTLDKDDILKNGEEEDHELEQDGEEEDDDEEEEFFFTDQITYINIIFNILNLIYATNPDNRKNDNPNTNDENDDILPLHLLYDRIYLLYCNIMNNHNIDRFIIKDYNDIGTALDYYLVHYLSFTNLQNDTVTMSLFEEEGIPFDPYTPNLVCKTGKEDEILYILQHHIGGIRTCQSYITNELLFNQTDNNQVIKKLKDQKIERKRFMYLDHNKEVYWMITIDNFLNNTAVLTIMPLSLIINENNNNSNGNARSKKISLNKHKDVFITNKFLNFMFFEKISVLNVTNFTMYQYMLGDIDINLDGEEEEEDDDDKEEVIVNRIIATGGFNKNYKDITTVQKSNRSKSKKKSTKLPKNTFASPVNSYRDSILISKSPTSFTRACSPTSIISRTRTNSIPRHQKHLSYSSNNKTLYTGYNSIPSSQRIYQSNASDYMSESTASSTYRNSTNNVPSVLKNILLLMSPISKMVIISILLQIKKQNKKNTKLIISRSLRFLLAGSLFGSILFTFINLMFILFNMYEIIMCSLDIILVFVLLFGVLVWVL